MGGPLLFIQYNTANLEGDYPHSESAHIKCGA